ncbi:MAG: hypothetical protein H6741_23080 [Alphaproteobacteria bacterium]|nr:hypothetical protein [Alphaproteobacteria bacterium]
MSELQARLLTLLIEVPLVLGVVWLKQWADDRRHWGRILVVAVAMSLITHPFAWKLNGDLVPYFGNPWARIAFIELIVALVESLLLWRWARLELRGAFALGFFVNLSSWGIGTLIFYALG